MALHTRQPESDALGPRGGKRERTHTLLSSTTHALWYPDSPDASHCFSGCQRPQGQGGDEEETELKDTHAITAHVSTRTPVETKTQSFCQGSAPSVRTSHPGTHLPTWRNHISFIRLLGDAFRPQ